MLEKAVASEFVLCLTSYLKLKSKWQANSLTSKWQASYFNSPKQLSLTVIYPSDGQADGRCLPTRKTYPLDTWERALMHTNERWARGATRPYRDAGHSMHMAAPRQEPSKQGIRCTPPSQ